MKPSLKGIACVVLLLFCSGCVPGEPTGPVLDEADQRALNEALGSSIERGELPGVVAVVASRDSILYRGAFGVLDDSGHVAMTDDALFRIWSMTKPITSVGIMMLREQELLDLDDPVAHYLPEFEDKEVLVDIHPADSSYSTRPAGRPMTIRHLLAHTSGYGYSFSSFELNDLTRLTGLSVRELPLLHDPGERWTYGMSTAILGEVIEVISGRTLPDFLEARIFQPLGMKETSYDIDPGKLDRLVTTYRRVDGDLKADPRPTEYQPVVRGDGGLLSTVDDYTRFLQMLLAGGTFEGQRLLSEESVREMTANQIGALVVHEQPGTRPAVSRAFPLGASRDKFGLGFQLKVGDDRVGRAEGSLSWAGIQNTHFWVDMESGVAVVLLLQVLPFYDEQAIDLLTTFEQALYRHME